jgi:putative transposase
MARRPRLFAPGLLYHVIVRGNQSQATFRDHQDYQFYLERMEKYRRKYDYWIHAYCLMPNHVHLLLESSNKPLAKFMQGLQQSYSQYFNLRHHKVGHVFQGRYKAIICEKHEYLLELVRYIHLNPVRAGMVQRPEGYRYSGHRAFLLGKPTKGIDPTKVLKLFGGKVAYKRFILEGLGGGHRDEYYEVDDQRFLGPVGFGDKVQKSLGNGPKSITKASIDSVVEKLAEKIGIKLQSLRSADRTWAVSKARIMLAYVLTRVLTYKLREVAEYLGRDTATVGTLVGRLDARLESDHELQQRVDMLAKIVQK